MSYKDSLNLPKTEMPMQMSLVKEQETYLHWHNTNAYSRFARYGENTFILHDGPPYANGDIHIGHALNKILKDFIVKFNYFNGRSVQFIPGWDCHGLPIEQQVNTLHKGENLEQHEFLKLCREYAASQVQKQMAQFKTLGIVADWDNRYETMSPEFEQMIAQKLYELKEKGYLTQRKKPVYWSCAYQTALAEAEVEYKDKEDLSAYVNFPVEDVAINTVAAQNNPKLNTFGVKVGLLVWTTTPWTLPANVALALNPNEQYLVVATDTCDTIVAASCYENLKQKGFVRDVLFSGEVVTNFLKNVSTATNPLNKNLSKIVFDEFVSTNQGTGVVHIAPGHGEVDYNVGLKYDLPVIMPVSPNGKYENVNHPDLEGLSVFVANEKVLELIGPNVVATEKIVHSYPHCWRSGKPVIFRATDQWFLNLDKLREQVIQEFEKTEFIPKNSKNRMRPMLEGRPDWCISRQRNWGVPIFDSGDILDVWFDSGLTWNVLGGKQADLYFEGNDQHRGWFQSSLWLSTALANQAPYKKVITHGFVVDGQGKKMAKSKGNVVAPNEVVKKYGAEVLRYWVSTTDYTSDVTVSNEILNRAAEGHRKLRNTLRYLVANTNCPSNKNAYLLPADHWILFKTNELFREVHQSFEDYSYFQGMQKLSEYINNDLSSIYMNAIKDRLYCNPLNDGKRQGAVFTLKTILNSMLPLIAPLFTYTAQEAFEYCSDEIKGKAKDVFDLVYFDPPKYSSYNPLLDSFNWEKALKDFHYHFDLLKKEGHMKDTLEVSLECDKELHFDGIEDWFVVGIVTEPTNKVCLASWDNFRIVKSDLNKCNRCWKRNVPAELEIAECNRCSKVLKDLK